tara:strand:- start:10451 stop:10750 length:300 start_codon:yes stop_codon:yes gene_type:complete
MAKHDVKTTNFKINKKWAIGSDTNSYILFKVRKNKKGEEILTGYKYGSLNSVINYLYQELNRTEPYSSLEDLKANMREHSKIIMDALKENGLNPRIVVD